MSNIIKMMSTTRNQYETKPIKDNNTLYWIRDTVEIYKGDTSYTEAFEFVDTLPVKPARGRIYIVKSSLKGFIWKEDENKWINIIEPLSNISNNRTIIFSISSKLQSGVLPLINKLEHNCDILDISAVCMDSGDEPCIIDIERLSETVLGTGAWSSILSGNCLQINPYELTSLTAPPYTLTTSTLNKGDVLRLNVLQSGNGIKGLSVQIKINIK